MIRPLSVNPSLRPFSVHLFWLCDTLTSPLILLMAVFSPWAFGTTQPWSVWTMNAAGYVLGLRLTAKLVMCKVTARLDRRCSNSVAPFVPPGRRASRLTRVLAGLTVAICGYCLVSALNGRSTYDPSQLSFTYHACLPWLPHSLDSSSTWFVFWTWLGLACSFWATREWLLGEATCFAAQNSPIRSHPLEAVLPSRLRQLLWLLSLNGAVLGLEGILQRFYGSGRLLFLAKPRFNPEAITQFGPYAYRGNAAQYFNLLWPVCLGFWWLLHRANRGRPARHHWLLLCAAVMAACPIISSSRGGALVCVELMVCSVLLVLVRRSFHVRRMVLPLTLSGGEGRGALALSLGDSALQGRNSKAEGRKKPEGRSPKAMARAHQLNSRLWCRALIVTLGLRISAFFRSSAFGFRIWPNHVTQTQRQLGRGEGAPFSRFIRSLVSRFCMHWHDQQGTVHRPTTLVLVSLGAAVGLGLCLGWKSLGPRLGQIEEDYAIRQQLYEMGKRMAADYAWFGTGPGTFESVFQFYRPTSESAWPAQLHNDWLETRITFGRFGCCLLLLAFGVVLLGACVGKGKSGVGTLTPFIGLAMAGVLVHARFDFPFQVLSIEFLFVVLCAVLFSGVHDPAPVYGAGNAHRKPMLLAR